MYVNAIGDTASRIDPGQIASRIRQFQNANPSDFASDLIASQDSGGDGALSIEEVSAGERAVPEALFSRADTDGDGLLSQADIERGVESRQAMIQKMQGLLSQAGLSSAQGFTDLDSALLETLSQGQANAAYGENALLESLFSERESGQSAFAASV